MKYGLFIIIMLFLVSAFCYPPHRLRAHIPEKSDSTIPAFERIYLENVEEIKQDPYSSDFDTSLKGGYVISFCYDSSTQYLLYKKGAITIDTLSSNALGLPYTNLGYIAADFDSVFVMAESFGGGNPRLIQMYRKRDLKNLIDPYSNWIDVDTASQLLLYFARRDTTWKVITLYDIRKNRKRRYPIPKALLNEVGKYGLINFKHVTDTTFTIEYQYDDWKRKGTKTYRR